MKRFFGYLIIFLGLFLAFGSADAQNRRQQLEQRRQALKEEINQFNRLLAGSKKERQNVLTMAEDLSGKIRATEQLIRTNNQEANLLTQEINENQDKITLLRRELEALKNDYAELMRKTYKSRSKKSRMMFLFSSENFLQAYKRLQYMKQYAKYREQQGEKIKSSAEELQNLNLELSKQREDLKEILAENRKTKARLEEDKKQQESLLAQINSQSTEYQKQINQRQKEISAIDAEIQRLIREAIAAENKKKGSTSTTTFALTPEAKALAVSFESNKGKLPWPVKAGNVIAFFGTGKSELVKHIPIQNNGIRIATNEGEEVFSIFKGKVMQIQAIKGSNKVIYVQHGNYISVYNNLDKIYVKKGQDIATGQLLGKVGKSTSTHRPTLHFYIFNNTKALDPLLWILRR